MSNTTNCIYQINPMSGLHPQHTRFCSYGKGTTCDEDTVQHVRLFGWCANLCRNCATTLKGAHPKAEITDEIVVDISVEV